MKTRTFSAVTAGLLAGFLLLQSKDSFGFASDNSLQPLVLLRQAGILSPTDFASALTTESNDETVLVSTISSQISEQQKENLLTLWNDLQQFTEDSTLVKEDIVALVATVHEIIDGASQPDPTLVAQLKYDFLWAIADQKITTFEFLVLKADLEQVLASAGIEPEEIEAFLEQLQHVVQASGLTSEEVAMLLDDLQAIIEEIQNNHG